MTNVMLFPSYGAIWRITSLDESTNLTEPLAMRIGICGVELLANAAADVMVSAAANAIAGDRLSNAPRIKVDVRTVLMRFPPSDDLARSSMNPFHRRRMRAE